VDVSARPVSSLVYRPGASAGNNAEPGAESSRGTRPASPIIDRPALKPASDDSVRLTGDTSDEMSRPGSADLIASVLPFDRATLEKAVDHFFQQLEDLNAKELVRRGPRPVVLLSLAVASTLTALELVRRRWRRRITAGVVRGREPMATGDHVGFPELPGSWSSRFS
jgi:hypothetical protein